MRDELDQPEQVGKLSSARPELVLLDSSAPPRKGRWRMARSRRALRFGDDARDHRTRPLGDLEMVMAKFDAP